MPEDPDVVSFRISSLPPSLQDFIDRERLARSLMTLDTESGRTVTRSEIVGLSASMGVNYLIDELAGKLNLTRKDLQKMTPSKLQNIRMSSPG